MTKKIWLVAASALAVAGLTVIIVAMSALKWDFSRLNTAKYKTETRIIYEKFNNISINTSTEDIIFARADDGKSKVVCRNAEHIKYDVTVKNDTLKIEETDTRKWYEFIGFDINSPGITLYLADDAYNAVTVKASTGDINIKSLSAQNINLSVSTGEIKVKNVKCDEDIKIKVSTGETNLYGVSCKNLITSGSTGEITLENLIAEDKISISRSTGDVEFENCDAAQIFVKTATGDVEGSLLTEKVFITQTNTGSVEVPQTLAGGKCEIITNTGDIEITCRQ